MPRVNAALRLVPADGLASTRSDVVPLELFERDQLGRRVDRSGAHPILPQLLGQILHRDLGEARQRDGALDAVGELPDVAGPLVLHQPLCRRQP
jgi:hypothetical protein